MRLLCTQRIELQVTMWFSFIFNLNGSSRLSTYIVKTIFFIHFGCCFSCLVLFIFGFVQLFCAAIVHFCCYGAIECNRAVWCDCCFCLKTNFSCICYGLKDQLFVPFLVCLLLCCTMPTFWLRKSSLLSVLAGGVFDFLLLFRVYFCLTLFYCIAFYLPMHKNSFRISSCKWELRPFDLISMKNFWVITNLIWNEVAIIVECTHFLKHFNHQSNWIDWMIRFHCNVLFVFLYWWKTKFSLINSTSGFFNCVVFRTHWRNINWATWWNYPHVRIVHSQTKKTMSWLTPIVCLNSKT